MARIRAIKREAFISESLTAVSVHADRTFFRLLTQADDHGRFREPCSGLGARGPQSGHTLPTGSTSPRAELS